MHVPDDFDADLKSISYNSTHPEFDLLVPKNRSRPVDRIFHYQLRAHGSTSARYVGFVELTEEDGRPLPVPSYIGSVVVFKKES